MILHFKKNSENVIGIFYKKKKKKLICIQLAIFGSQEILGMLDLVKKKKKDNVSAKNNQM